METFMGFERPDGCVGIRNHVAVVPSVSCANGVVQAIAGQVPEAVPLYHCHGCGRGGADLELHQRALQNLARNPNIAALLVVGLGCEPLRAEGIALAVASSEKPVKHLVIQEEGGSKKTAARGVEILREFLAHAAELQRKPIPLNRLTLGLECGGSDAFSGLTANPAVGVASDWLVDSGGTVILTETTEMIGTAHILARRAADDEVAHRISKIISETEKKTHEVLGPLAKFVISPGNMDGGMSSIQEKSLGCIVKGGTKEISQVVDYAEPPEKKGLIIMDGPGYDTDSLTGLAAAGSQLIIFTTGRGNPIGFPVVPVIKVASNSRVYRQMLEDMDINAGAILEGKSMEDLGAEIIDLVKKVISGMPTKAEINEQNGMVCVYTRNTSF